MSLGDTCIHGQRRYIQIPDLLNKELKEDVGIKTFPAKQVKTNSTIHY